MAGFAKLFIETEERRLNADLGELINFCGAFFGLCCLCLMMCFVTIPFLPRRLRMISIKYFKTLNLGSRILDGLQCKDPMDTR